MDYQKAERVSYHNGSRNFWSFGQSETQKLSEWLPNHSVTGGVKTCPDFLSCNRWPTVPGVQDPDISFKGGGL
jgi:hypothetical protein